MSTVPTTYAFTELCPDAHCALTRAAFLGEETFDNHTVIPSDRSIPSLRKNLTIFWTIANTDSLISTIADLSLPLNGHTKICEASQGLATWLDSGADCGQGVWGGGADGNDPRTLASVEKAGVLNRLNWTGRHCEKGSLGSELGWLMIDIISRRDNEDLSRHDKTVERAVRRWNEIYPGSSVSLPPASPPIASEPENQEARQVIDPRLITADS